MLLYDLDVFFEIVILFELLILFDILYLVCLVLGFFIWFFLGFLFFFIFFLFDEVDGFFKDNGFSRSICFWYSFFCDVFLFFIIFLVELFFIFYRIYKYNRNRLLVKIYCMGLIY